MIKAILLAAGKSKRLISENKLIKKFKNKPLINHSLLALHILFSCYQVSTY